jgi:hypothetical protein
MQSAVNPNNVSFSSGARVLWGDVGASYASLIPLGLLGADMQFDVSQEMMYKSDYAPDVVVAAAPMSQKCKASGVLHEISAQNIQLLFGLPASAVTVTAGTDQNITNEAYTFPTTGNNLNTVYLSKTVKTATTPVVTNVGGLTTYTANTDYIFLKSATGGDMLYRIPSGTIPAGATVEIDYTHAPVAKTSLSIGNQLQTVEKQVVLEEDARNGRKMAMFIHRGIFSMAGSLTMGGRSNTSWSFPFNLDGLASPTNSNELFRLEYS